MRTLILFSLVTLTIFSRCQTKSDTITAWEKVEILDKFGDPTGETFIRTEGVNPSDSLFKPTITYHKGILTVSTYSGYLDMMTGFVGEVYVKTPDNNEFKFTFLSGEIVEDLGTEPQELMIQLLEHYDSLKMSNGRYFWTVSSNGFVR